MAASPISDHRPSRQRFARRARRGDPGDHQGSHCQMCGQRVMLDAQGRCQLGHQVTPRAQMAARSADSGARAVQDAGADDEDVVASYSEPRTGFGPVVPVGAWVTEKVAPVEPVREPEALPLHIPDRLRNPLPDSTPPAAHARTLFSDQPGTDEIALPVAEASDDDSTPSSRTSLRFAEADNSRRMDTHSIGASRLRSALDSEAAPTTARLNAAVQTADLTPAAVSVLDVEPSDWYRDWTSDSSKPSGEKHEDAQAANTDWTRTSRTDVGKDDNLQPPRSWGSRIAGALFVLALLGVAWYLAVTI